MMGTYRNIKTHKMLSSRIDKIEKTIETYDKLIGRLETRLSRHERSYAHGGSKNDC